MWLSRYYYWSKLCNRSTRKIQTCRLALSGYCIRISICSAVKYLSNKDLQDNLHRLMVTLLEDSNDLIIIWVPPPYTKSFICNYISVH